MSRKSDSADDLFGYPPRPLTTCPKCGRLAEPFDGDHCWSCAQRLTRAAATPPRNAGRVPAKAKCRTRAISPVYTPVATG